MVLAMKEYICYYDSSRKKEGMIQMSDVFKEQMVAVKKTSSDGIKKTGIVIAAIIIGFF